MIIRVAATYNPSVPSELFDLYRQSYNQPADLVLSKQYVTDQLRSKNTTILVAHAIADTTRYNNNGLPDIEDKAIGFLQFGYRVCSCLGKILLVNDLFVDPDNRNMGVGKALMNAALECGKIGEASAVELETEVDNISAQRLYESLGYKRDTRYTTYTRSVV